MPITPATNGFAIAALVLSIVWLCAVGSVLAVIFGLVALSQIKRAAQEGKPQGGRGLAIAGLVVGIVGLVATVLVYWAINRAADDLHDAAGEIFTSQEDELDDAAITSCLLDASGFATAELTVTNDSSKPSSYLLGLDFLNDDATVLGTVSGAIDRLEPGETTRVAFISTTKPTGQVTCGNTTVLRFANVAG